MSLQTHLKCPALFSLKNLRSFFEMDELTKNKQQHKFGVERLWLHVQTNHTDLVVFPEFDSPNPVRTFNRAHRLSGVQRPKVFHR